jgi:carbon storage regulator
MLVLSRKLLEKLVIGDNITVQILAIQGNRVRLGITAPANVPVLREELSQCPSQQLAPGDSSSKAPALAGSK